MAYDAAALTLARTASRWNFTRGNILPPGFPPNPIEDTSAETMAAIRRSLAHSVGRDDPLEDPAAAAERRRRLSEPGAVPTKIPRKPSPTEFRGQHKTITLSATAILGVGNTATVASGTFNLPKIVRRVLVSTNAVAENEIELVLTTTNIGALTAANILASDAIWPDQNHISTGYGQYAVAAGAPFAIPMDHIIQTVPFELVAWLRNTTAGPHRAILYITLQDLDPEDLRVITVPVILQQQVLTRSLNPPAPPAPRQFSQPYEWLGGKIPAPTTRPVTAHAPPRGIKLKEFQAGRLLYSRDIPWQLLDPVLQKRFMVARFNNETDPTMEPIW